MPNSVVHRHKRQKGKALITIYGIRNCDTIKKSLKWADEQGLEHHFHDYRKEPVSEEHLLKWLAEIDRDVLINKRGTTYRKLTDAQKETLEGDGAVSLLQEQPTIMKRPLFDLGNGVFVVGFKDEQKDAVLAAL
ncbi:Spx/MgsR family RNA polymerase-binding regulatory protein [Sneathiella aquimaris]|uniref:Spx/MgsR family RNA polymerase-binding regulatory protein n=1 Tax=Sneathiella aquimaris TaxID=2599305 RepID=UPI001CA5ACC5|nr:Spx/MgsR family RNA polymerase-binding regulatory protein [Sneathiella aquimaris]